MWHCVQIHGTCDELDARRLSLLRDAEARGSLAASTGAWRAKGDGLRPAAKAASGAAVGDALDVRHVARPSEERRSALDMYVVGSR